MSEPIETAPPQEAPHAPSRWEAYVWPKWLPTRARLPLIAQFTAGIALLAALTMPAWSEMQPEPAAVPHLTPIPLNTGVVPHAQPIAPQPPPDPMRPAHLNLDVRHSFASVALTVTVDDERVLETKLEGNRKRFGAFGKRSEKGFTRTLDLDPGIRVVRVRVRSTADNFDQTRVERFELGSASVASMRIAADNSGLSIFADRPAPPAPIVAQMIPALPAHPAATAPAASGAAPPTATGELYEVLRSMLIAVTGFIASAATGFVVQEFLRQKKRVLGL